MLNQTVTPDEIVIVEDGPLNDSLYSVLDEYEGKITRVHNEKNIGLGLALNVGLKACRNELVARMDTDDISKPDRCKKQLKRFEEKPELAIVGAWVPRLYPLPPAHKRWGQMCHTCTDYHAYPAGKANQNG